MHPDILKIPKNIQVMCCVMYSSCTYAPKTYERSAAHLRCQSNNKRQIKTPPQGAGTITRVYVYNLTPVPYVQQSQQVMLKSTSHNTMKVTTKNTDYPNAVKQLPPTVTSSTPIHLLLLTLI